MYRKRSSFHRPSEIIMIADGKSYNSGSTCYAYYHFMQYNWNNQQNPAPYSSIDFRHTEPGDGTNLLILDGSVFSGWKWDIPEKMIQYPGHGLDRDTFDKWMPGFDPPRPK
jgi:hypothetical protein